MNRTRLIVCLGLAALTLSSCLKEEPQKAGVKLSFTAGFAENKAQMHDQSTIWWNAGDAIHVFSDKTSLGKFVSTNTSPASKATFVSVDPVTPTSGNFMAVYPYNDAYSSDGACITLEIPAQQVAPTGGFDPIAFPSVAKAESYDFPFYNVCGGMVFTVSQTGIKSVTLSGNNGEMIAGRIQVGFNGNKTPVIRGIIQPKSEVTVYAPSEGEFEVGKKYYMSLLPVSLDGGIKLTYRKAYTQASITTSTPLEIKRSIFGKVENKDAGLVWSMLEATDLSKDGTANCYIVSKPGYYKFKATVKGGTEIALDRTPVKAETVWESFGTTVKPNVGSVVTSVNYSNGYVYFYTPATFRNGNAVISVKDGASSDSKVCWSWHIWVCKDFDPSLSAQIYANNAGTFMDRNLGATSAVPGQVQALGLMYQWGRKDPFPAAGQIYYASDLYLESAKATIDVPSYVVESTPDNGTIDMATLLPSVFISRNKNNEDWYYSVNTTTDDTRWRPGNQDKGIYDPCPYGWRVPDGGETGSWSTAFGQAWPWMNMSNWDATNCGMDYGKSDIRLGSSSSIWYPAAGYYIADRPLGVVGKKGLYWTCTPNGNKAKVFNFGNDGYTTPAYEDVRASAMSVRCVKDGSSIPGPVPEGKTHLTPVASDPMNWVAVAPDGSWMEDYPTSKSGKTVGIYYFIWHGCHGYDTFLPYNEVHYPTKSDVKSPFNNEEIYKKDPAHPKNLPFGDFDVFHHWGEPYLGYYIADDRWVFRKHAQMLSDAGVDVAFMDATNGYDYIDNFLILGQEWENLRKKGNKTPAVSYLCNVETNRVVTRLWDRVFSTDKFRDLWFQWESKPMILALDTNVENPTLRSKFTFRMSWFTYNIPAMDTWWEDVQGKNRLPWGGWYPQKPGYTQGGMLESMSVMAATHPLDKMGRSFDPIAWKEPAVPISDQGIHFKKQLEYALTKNPSFLFFTGWNEWVAQRQRPSKDYQMLGMSSYDFGCAFVDHFNHEYSRDLEPVRGGFGDAYYYYLCDAVRKFKGVVNRKPFREKFDITLDGYADDWEDVAASFGDDIGDATPHSHIGWGRIGILTNHARNDIELCKVAYDGKNLYFYAQTSEKLSPETDADWMKLYIGVNSKKTPNWEGFNFVVQRTPTKGDQVVLERCSSNGYNWTPVGYVSRAVGQRIVEICIPIEGLGISDPTNFEVDFKWVDDTCSDGDIQTCMSDGDAAPNGRFRYRYKWSKSLL